MHRLTISKRETVTQFNDNLMTQFNEWMGHKRIKLKKHSKSLSLKMQETTSKSVAITENLVTHNKHGWILVKYVNVLHLNRTQKQL